VGVGLRLQHRLVTVAGEALEGVADLPLAGRDPPPVGSLIHGRSGFVHRFFAQFAQVPLKDFLVHCDLLKCDQPLF
jgi:hypothetical protein